MKLSFTATLAFLLSEGVTSFVPSSPLSTKSNAGGSSKRYMAMDMPPPAKTVDLPVIQQSSFGPADLRYSDFLKLVDADRIEKVTFSSDGSQLLGVDVDGSRLKIEALPNDPGLLSQLTEHKVRAIAGMKVVTVCKISQLFLLEP